MTSVTGDIGRAGLAGRRRGQTEQLVPRCGILSSAPIMDFNTLYRLEFASMVALARAICGDHEQAEDIAQEAFSRAHTHWERVSGYDRPGAWVRRVTTNLALSRRRRLQRELSVLHRTAQETLSAFRASDDPAEGSDDEVWRAVGKLAPKQRAAVALFYQEDLSTADIAEALGCTVSTATSHLHQARMRLAALLDEPFEDNSGTKMRRWS